MYGGTPYVGSNNSATMQPMWTAIANATSLLQADGLNVVVAPVAAVCGTTGCNQYDGIHPNDTGHALIAGAFESVVTSPSALIIGKLK